MWIETAVSSVVNNNHACMYLIPNKNIQMDLQLQDKTAFISGSTAGIGRAIAEALLKEKATVIINGRTREAVNKTIAALQKSIPGAMVSGIAADFGKTEDVTRLVNELP